jgi:hypothetical protein
MKLIDRSKFAEFSTDDSVLKDSVSISYGVIWATAWDA